MTSFRRIAMNPGDGPADAHIKGKNVSVQTILDLTAEGCATTEILQRYPQLDREDVQQAILFAAQHALRQCVSLDWAPGADPAAS